MGTQRYISTSFYDDRWIQSLDPTEKFIYLYLLTNPLTNIAGVYKIEDRRISFDTGYTTEVVGFVLEKFQKSGKAYRRDEYIVIPSWPKHQKWEGKSKIRAGIEAILKKLPAELLDFLKKIPYAYPIDTLSISYTYPSNYSDLDLDLDSDLDNKEAAPPVFPENPSSSKLVKPKKAPLREREPVNDMERVEKAYLLNWDTLYSQGKVKAINPVVNWNQTRKLLKTHFETLDAELIIQAVNNALNDDWVLNAGYSLGMMLSASVLNRLINGNGSAPQKHRIGADNVSQEKVSSYFREAK
jgi:hypothetical protein